VTIQDAQVSVLGSHYFTAIAGLIDDLRALPHAQFRDDLPPGQEAGLAASICILVTVSFESWVRKLILMAPRICANPRLHPLEFLRDAYPAFPRLPTMYEVFVVRDLLVHNHIWEIDLTGGDSYNMSITSATLTEGAPDSKYRNYVDASTRRTKLLNLHVIPTQVDAADAAIVTRTAWDSLLWLQANTHLAMSVDHYPLNRAGKKLYFATYVAELEQDAQHRRAARPARP